MNRFEKGVTAATVAVILVQLALYGAAIYAIVHFVRKYW